jgi:cobalt/nickel transport system permease protein
VVHRADARLKFLLTIGFILALSLLPTASFLALGIAWLAVLAVSVAAKLGPVRVIRGSVVALPFVFAALPLLFTKHGDPIGSVDFGLFKLTLSGEGIRTVATITLKSWISVQAATLLVFSTPFHDLLEGLARLKLPKLMVAIISLMYRYLAVLTGEASRMMRARSSRMASSEDGKRPGWVWQAKVVGSMVGSLFIRSYERSERVYLAMQSRGYSGHIAHVHERPLRATGWLALGAGAALLGAFELTAYLWMPHS